MEAAEAHAATRFSDLLLVGDRQVLLAEARRIFETRGVTELYESVIAPALCEIGARWDAGEITVADEHVATAAAQVVIASLYPQFPWPVRRSPRVLVAGVEGNRHELGLRMVADLLALDGWDDLFLGADVPVDALVAKAAEFQPAVVALGVTLRAHLAALERTIAALRARLGSPRILVGGRACGEMRDRVLALGVTVVARGAQAVEVAREWR